MKRHVQVPGIRQWAAEDFLELQSEPLKVIDGFFEEYGPCVIRGCNVTDNGNETYNVTAGLVALTGVGNTESTTFKVVPFSGIIGTPLPVYLTLANSMTERQYVDGGLKPIAYDYKASVTTVKPKNIPFLELGINNVPRFVDVIQNSSHRFITDEDYKKLQNSITYTHPKTHPASMIVFDDGDTLQDKFNLSQQVSYEYTLEVAPTSLSFGPAEAVKGLSISSFRTKFMGGISTGIKEQVPYTATVVSGAEAFFLEEVAVTARQNDTETSRSGTIQVVQEGSEKTVTVSLTQEAGVVTWEHSFVVIPISMNFTYAAGTQNVSIISSKQKKINGINTGSPISVGFTSAVTTGSGIFSVDGIAISTNRNDTEAIRGGAVTYTQNESGKTAVVSLSQAAGQVTWEYTLSVTPSSLSFGASGGIQTVNLTSYKRKYINSIYTGEQVNVGCDGSISGLGYGLSGTAIIAEQNETFRTKSEIATFTQFGSEKKVLVSISQSYTGLIPSEAPNGVYIVHTNGKMYSRSNWKVSENSNAVGIGVKTENCSFIIAPDEQDKMPWSSNEWTFINGCPIFAMRDAALTDYKGEYNTDAVIAQFGISDPGAVSYCRTYMFKTGKKGYLPSVGEWNEAYQNKEEVDACMSLIGGKALYDSSIKNFNKWSSTQNDEVQVWYYNWENSYILQELRRTYNYVRPFATLL